MADFEQHNNYYVQCNYNCFQGRYWLHNIQCLLSKYSIIIYTGWKKKSRSTTHENSVYRACACTIVIRDMEDKTGEEIL